MQSHSSPGAVLNPSQLMCNHSSHNSHCTMSSQHWGVFSVFIPLSEAWLRKDDRIAINRDFYYSSDSYILTRYLLSRRLLISRKFFSVHCGFSFLPSYHSIHGVVQRILSQKHASSVHIEGDGGVKWFKELPITVRVITCSWKNVNQVPGVSTSSSKLVFGNSWSWGRKKTRISV